MNLSTAQVNGYYVISVEGDLDASSALQLDVAIKKALEQKVSKLVIDCGKLNYVSSSGLGVFISYLSDFETNKVYFALLHVQEKILNTLNILGLTKLLNIIDKIPNA